jgi:hypothetical protein
MQTLIFNTTEKTVKVYKDHNDYSDEIFSYTNVTTVKPVNNAYEVYQSKFGNTMPVLRVPISATNMIIEK